MDYTKALFEQNELFGRLIVDADYSLPVPACPGWNLLQLARHVGRGDRWAGQIVSDRMDPPLNPRDVRGGKPPEDPADLVAWLSDSGCPSAAPRLVPRTTRARPTGSRAGLTRPAGRFCRRWSRTGRPGVRDHRPARGPQ
ncbi:MAG: maleylpyruvate isomerase N-terminal domain-containing protein [Pseudonocardia sp.]